MTSPGKTTLKKPSLIKVNGCNFGSSSSQKHLGRELDEKLNFDEHVQSKINKCNKLISIIKRLSITFLRDALLAIYRSFIRPHLDYADIVYDKSSNDSFPQKIENIQYRSCLTYWGYSRNIP